MVMPGQEQPPYPVPLIDLARCTGCGLCVQACPNGALDMKSYKAYVARPDQCDYTGYCELACPAQAIERPFEIVIAPDKEHNAHKENKESIEMTPQTYRALIGAGLAALLAGGLLLAQRDGRLAAGDQRTSRPRRANHEDLLRTQRLSDSHESSRGEQ